MKVYIVSYESQNSAGEHDFENKRAFMSEYLAAKWMHEYAATVVESDYDMTMEELRGEAMKENSLYELEDNHLDVFMMNNGDCSWDKLEVHELELDGSRRYMDVLFNHEGKMFSERVYMDLIDLDHYETCWSWIFGSHTDGFAHDDDLVFELCGDKHEDGIPALTNLYIEVYCNSMTSDPCCRISNFQIRTSWSGEGWYHTAE